MTTNAQSPTESDAARRFGQIEVDSQDAPATSPSAPSSRFANLEIDDPAPAPAIRVTFVDEDGTRTPVATSGVVPASTASGAASAIEASVGAPRTTPAIRQPLSAPAFERGLRPQGEASPVASIQAMASQIVAVEQADASTGAVVFWALSGSLEVARLTETWAAEGLDTEWLLPVPSPVVALRRAVQAQVSRGQFTAEHPDGGWVLVDEKKDDHALSYAVGLRFRLTPVEKDDEATVRVVELIDIPAHIDAAAAQSTLDAVRAEFGMLRRGIVESVDVSSWLTKLLDKHLSSVALRESGGFYFVPRQSVETWGKIKRALGAVSAYKLAEIPAMRSTETVAAVLDAVRRESDVALSEMENELNLGTLGNRGNANRIKACDVLKAKVVGFEKLLGLKLAEVVARIDALRGKLEAVTTRTETLIID